MTTTTLTTFTGTAEVWGESYGTLESQLNRVADRLGVTLEFGAPVVTRVVGFFSRRTWVRVTIKGSSVSRRDLENFVDIATSIGAALSRPGR